MVLEIKKFSLLSILSRKKRRPPPTLLDMPDVPMQLILKYCDLPEILNLYKTCHDLRSYIKTVKPIPKIVKMIILEAVEGLSDADKIRLFIVFDKKSNRDRYNLYPIGSCIRVDYRKDQSLIRDGCRFFWEQHHPNWKVSKYRMKLSEDQNYMEVFMRDFKILLDLHKLPIRKISFCGEYRGFSKFFDQRMSGQKPIRAYQIRFYNYVDSKIMNILPHFCAETIQYLGIGSNTDNGEDYVTIDKVTKTEQWKKARQISVSPGPLMVKLGSFMHLENGFVKLHTITVDQIRVVKEAFLHTLSTSKYFKVIWLDPLAPKEAIFDYLGCPMNCPIDIEDRLRHWIYRRPKHPDQCLLVHFYHENHGYKCFSFEIIKFEEVTEHERDLVQLLEIEAEGTVEDVDETEENHQESNENGLLEVEKPEEFVIDAPEHDEVQQPEVVVEVENAVPFIEAIDALEQNEFQIPRAVEVAEPVVEYMVERGDDDVIAISFLAELPRAEPIQVEVKIDEEVVERSSCFDPVSRFFSKIFC